MKDKSLKHMILLGGVITILGTVLMAWIHPWCAVLFFVFAALLIAIYSWEIKKRRDKLQQLNIYLSLICAGKYDLDIADNEEGEISILKNNLYKVIVLLRSQNAMLEKDKVYLADAIANISHQLKTPLTSMMVMTELLEREQEETKRKQFVETIDKQLDKMKWLITYLLRLSKLDAGTVVFHTDEIALKEVWEASIEPYLLTMDLRNISVEKGKLEGTIRGDFNWTCEAVGNIVKNCMEHMDDGGHLYVETKDYSLYQSLILRDDGCGIEKDELPHIFERFYNGKRAKKDSVGIGLALSKAIVEKEEGKILVKSEVGEGTEFEIRFYKMIV